MGRKFDKSLPAMTDEKLAAVDETLLDKKSRNRLDIERGKRAFKSASGRDMEDRWQFYLTTLVAVATVVVVLIGCGRQFRVERKRSVAASGNVCLMTRPPGPAVVPSDCQ